MQSTKGWHGLTATQQVFIIALISLGLAGLALQANKGRVTTPNAKSASAPTATSVAASPPPAPPKEVVTTGTEGEVVYPDGSNESIFVGRDESAHEELNRAFRAKDQYGLGELILNGRAFQLPSRTRVLVIDAGFLTHTIRILEGPHRGKSAIIAAEFVQGGSR